MEKTTYTKPVTVTTSVTKPVPPVLKSGRLCLEGDGFEIARLLTELLPAGEIEAEVNFRVLE